MMQTKFVHLLLFTVCITLSSKCVDLSLIEVMFQLLLSLQIEIASQINISPFTRVGKVSRLQLLIRRAGIIARAKVLLDNAQKGARVHFRSRSSRWWVAFLSGEEALFFVFGTSGKGRFHLADFVLHSLSPEFVDFVWDFSMMI